MMLINRLLTEDLSDEEIFKRKILPPSDSESEADIEDNSKIGRKKKTKKTQKVKRGKSKDPPAKKPSIGVKRKASKTKPSPNKTSK